MTAVLDEPGEKILLIWRHRFIVDQWDWEVPGGYADPGEDGTTTAAREVEHASWLNQIEIFFSITQKKVLSPNDFASLGELSGTLLAFADHYNQTARPFNWKYTSADLARLLDKINRPQQTASPPQAA